MLWIVFTILTAVLAAGHQIIKKKALFKEHAIVFSMNLATIILILSVFLIPFANFSNIELSHVLIIYLASLLSTVAFYFLAKSLRHKELSAVSPFTNLSPALVAIIAFFLLGETITKLQIGGISLMVVGAYVLNSENIHGHFLEPFKRLNSKYFLFIIIALTFYALTATIERFLFLDGVTPFTFLIILHFFIFINFFLLTNIIFHQHIGAMKESFKRSGFWLILSGVVTIVTRGTHVYAVSLAPAVALVIGVKRISTLLSTIIGGEIFHEKGLGRKIVACIIMLVGAYLLLF
ncbi:EamA family transporter [Candidatus Woesearchaeota archaeon]|jgi:drug/metabolite transporter (DMT)-like permease|nr:EamA family transporter [Candidatus Woesearchaeota archaeon]MBT6520244.1 EamA family transporter [Candidatus Woesearchaeota archaeon]MBT7367255.1 EamA family transporter [Candidatus Woesearchaeota archaeon]